MHVFCLLCMTVVLQERTHQTLLNGVEHFDKATMKHTETSEKVVLPDKDGEYILINWGKFGIRS